MCASEIDRQELRQLLDTAVAAARAGAAVLQRYFRQGDLQIAEKGENDFVTRADRESEAAVLGEIRRSFPGHGILAEEGGGGEERAADGGHLWVVDPLDGTTNFLQGLPVYCVSVACLHAGRPVAAVVADPAGGNLFTASLGGGAQWNGRPMATSPQRGLRGAFLATGYPFRAHSTLDVYLATFREIFLQAKAVRRCGAAALDLAYTAAGVYDGFFEFRLSPWDIGAGILLVEEAGGVVTDVDGGQGYLSGGNVVAGGSGLHPELRAAVALHASEAELDRISPATRHPALAPAPAAIAPVPAAAGAARPAVPGARQADGG